MTLGVDRLERERGEALGDRDPRGRGTRAIGQLDHAAAKRATQASTMALARSASTRHHRPHMPGPDILHGPGLVRALQALAAAVSGMWTCCVRNRAARSSASSA